MRKLITCCLPLLLFISCATLPKETVELSKLLTQQIELLKESHKQVVIELFEREEQLALDYLYNVHSPEFVKNLLQQEEIKSAGLAAFGSDDLAVKSEFVLAITQFNQDDFNNRSQQVLGSIHAARDKVVKVIEQEYDKALTINRAITRNLASVKGVNAFGKEYIDSRVDLDKINTTIDEGLASIKQMEEIVDSGREMTKKINQVLKQ